MANEKEDTSGNCEQPSPKSGWWKHFNCDLGLNVIIAIATVALAIYTYKLWSVTHKLVVDAEQTAKNQASDTATLLQLTKQAADAASNAAKAAQDSAKAAISANLLSHDNFIADHRPWITADIELVSPLTWGPNGGSFTLRFTLRNIGQTPALDALISPEVFADPPFGRKPPLDAISIQRLLSKKVQQKSENQHWGVTIFPGDTITLLYELTISNSEIERIRSFKKDRNIGPFYLVIVGCIEYRLLLGGDYHQTGFIRELHHNPDPPKHGVVLITPEKGDIPILQLILLRPIFGDGMTN